MARILPSSIGEVAKDGDGLPGATPVPNSMAQFVRRLGPQGPRRRVIAEELLGFGRSYPTQVGRQVVVDPDVAGMASDSIAEQVDGGPVVAHAGQCLRQQVLGRRGHTVHPSPGYEPTYPFRPIG